MKTTSNMNETCMCYMEMCCRMLFSQAVSVVGRLTHLSCAHIK